MRLYRRVFRMYSPLQYSLIILLLSISCSPASRPPPPLSRTFTFVLSANHYPTFMNYSCGLSILGPGWYPSIIIIIHRAGTRRAAKVFRAGPEGGQPVHHHPRRVPVSRKYKLNVVTHCRQKLYRMMRAWWYIERTHVTPVASLSWLLLDLLSSCITMRFWSVHVSEMQKYFGFSDPCGSVSIAFHIFFGLGLCITNSLGGSPVWKLFNVCHVQTYRH